MHMCSPYGSTILSSHGARSCSSSRYVSKRAGSLNPDWIALTVCRSRRSSTRSASICLSTLIVSALPDPLGEHCLGDLDGRRRHREVEVRGEVPDLPELRGPAL